MKPADLQLPDDVETLKAMVLAMAEKAARAEALESEVADLKARNADADERIERLTQILKAFDRARFGRRSEKLGSPGIDDEQQAFVFEENRDRHRGDPSQGEQGCRRYRKASAETAQGLCSSS